MNRTDNACPHFRPTHPEAAGAAPVLGCRIADEAGGVSAVVVDTGADTIWLAAADVEPFIEWLRSCA